MLDRITARRDALAAQLAQAKQQYAELEATLLQLDRQLCAMQGGIQELDALLEDVQHRQEDQQPQREQPEQPQRDDADDQAAADHDGE